MTLARRRVTTLMLRGAAAVGSAGAAFLSSGVAVASPDMTGESYSDASAALKGAGFTPIVQSVVGDKTAQGDCTVIRQKDVTPGLAAWVTSNTVNGVFVGGDQPTNFSGPGYGNEPSAGRVMLTLACYPGPKVAPGLATGTGDINAAKPSKSH
jgi:hypothetical protein